MHIIWLPLLPLIYDTPFVADLFLGDTNYHEYLFFALSGRFYDGQILDMAEFGIEKFVSITEFKVSFRIVIKNVWESWLIFLGKNSEF